MSNARVINTIKRLASLSVWKFVSIFAISIIVASSAGFVASASTTTYRPAILGDGAYTVSVSSTLESNSTHHRLHQGPSNTSTTHSQIPSGTAPSTVATRPQRPATTSLGTTTIQPQVATTKQPAPTTTQPAPTATKQPAPTTTQLQVATTKQPAPTTTQPTLTASTTVHVTSTTRSAVGPPYPLGIASSTEPSGLAPPSSNDLPGYSLTYMNDFTGTSIPAGWSTYDGQPGGDPGAQWSSSHVVVGSGILSLNAWQDPAFGNSWVTGGLCQCGVAKTYGAYFVRSRMTGPGATGVELLWPKANVWPPEIDFSETFGSTTGSTATVHFGATNQQQQHSITIDMTKWHTWGVIWTPASITYTVDGQAFGTITIASEIPNQAMTLDLQQQTWCGSGWACPSAPQSMQIDWVTEYSVN